jgi:hypothetical protein
MFKKSAAPAAGGYTIAKSLRFRSSASAYLTRTPTVASNRTTWTWSAWIKLGELTSASTYTLFSADNGGGTDRFQMSILANVLNASYYNGTTYPLDLNTSAVYRDPAAWYHFVFALDTTQATASDRVKVYVNGVQATFSSPTYPAQNTSLPVNSTVPTDIGRRAYYADRYFDGEMAEVYFIDGQALTASSFGSFSGTGGVWQPKKYTGTYGTNGFYLKFTNTTSTATLGNDSSGNSNTWTVNNISLTAGTTYDSMTDVPTLTSATAANYQVMNPLNYVNGSAPTNGNLKCSNGGSGVETIVNGTIGITTGKWYWEATASGTLTNLQIGIQSALIAATSSSTTIRGYTDSGNKRTGSTYTAYGSTFTNGDVISIAVDMDAGKIWFGKNNTWQASGDPAAGTNAAFTDVSGTVTAWMTTYNTGAGTSNWEFNFGQQGFAYTPPTGFKAVNTYNLATPTIAAGNQYMDATLYTGTGSSLSVTNAGSFKPDLVWVKSRSAATDHKLTDSVRGVTKALISDTTGAETTDANGLTAFNANGWTLGSDSVYNTNLSTYVGWQWQAGQGSTSTNTNGSITSTVSVNQTAGFSIVTYTGTGANATVGHGLGVAPQLIIGKKKSAVGDWTVYHVSTGNTSALFLNSSAAIDTSIVYWNNTTPTSSVFSLGTGPNLNASAATNVAYCWTPIAGFSQFGSYTGNGSTDGPFIYTGFRPKYVMIKRYDAGTQSWVVMDSSRNTYNQVNLSVEPNTTSAETSIYAYEDFLSNGVKLRTSDSAWNGNGNSYIYAAFAENPFKYALAR